MEHMMPKDSSFETEWPVTPRMVEVGERILRMYGVERHDAGKIVTEVYRLMAFTEASER